MTGRLEVSRCAGTVRGGTNGVDSGNYCGPLSRYPDRLYFRGIMPKITLDFFLKLCYTIDPIRRIYGLQRARPESGADDTGPDGI